MPERRKETVCLSLMDTTARSLQTNVVQLLKDPIIQAATCGWKTEISSDGSGKTEINTNTALCKVGNRSLKLESTAKTGSVCWYQDVSLLKGQTYTVSMFVKVTKMDRASDGAVFLRAKYQDKDNVWHYEDSEQLKSTTTDFIQCVVKPLALALNLTHIYTR